MKSALIITYYWPPAGGVEVHRVVKFCKYLSENGWTPQVLTVEPGRYSNRDDGLSGEVAQVEPVVRSKSLEPHVLFHALAGKKKSIPSPTLPAGRPSARQRITGRIGEYIRLNLFLPDARIGWYPYAVRAGRNAWNEQPPDLLFSTAPPYTVHLVARSLSRQWNCPWVADFRDPWVENYAYNTVPRLPWVKAWNQRMERAVLREADAVICATPGQRTIQSGKVDAAQRDKFHLITNGYDATPPEALERTDRFYLSYFGTLSQQRLPPALLPALQALCAENADFARDFQFRAIGRIDPDVDAQIREILPNNHLVRGHIPLHELTPLQAQEQMMLALVDAVPFNELIIPAKLFEILPTGNPILGIGPANGDAAALLGKHEGGVFCEPHDQAAIEKSIGEAFINWTQHKLARTPRHIPALQRRTLTKQLADVFDAVCR